MDSLISRQAAIDDIDTLWDYSTVDGITASTVLKQVRTDIMNLPSVQERKGRWIVSENPETGWYRVTCSECGEDVTSTIPMIGFFPDAKPLWNYCHNCGSKNMEGVEE